MPAADLERHWGTIIAQSEIEQWVLRHAHNEFTRSRTGLVLDFRGGQLRGSSGNGLSRLTSAGSFARRKGGPQRTNDDGARPRISL